MRHLLQTLPASIPHLPLRAWLGGRTGRKADRSWRARLLVQSAFAATCVLLGVQFAQFYRAAQQGALPLPVRPPGVEGFLPISGLMGLVDWVHQGTLNRIHPAATILLLIAAALALLLRKSFCAWICPVGFLSEALARVGRRLFGRNFRIWRSLDVPLRGLKYLLLAFFAYSIAAMHQVELRFFLESPYNRVADVKMALFFAQLGRTAGITLLVLVVASVFVQGLWCRYLCPYGALLGLLSRLSPVRVRRAPASCIDCKLCDKVCMARLPVSTAGALLSAECTGCLDCVAVCPVSDTLTIHAGGRRIGVLTYATAVVLLFVAGYAGARAAGLWRNGIGDREYVERIQDIHGAQYGHPAVNGRGGNDHSGRGESPGGGAQSAGGAVGPRTQAPPAVTR